MADRDHSMSGTGSGRLDATGTREVVYCHQCESEWYRDEHGLACPRCECEFTEIVGPNSDPRPIHDEPPPRSPPLQALHDHDPWADADISDPEEADIEEHVTHGPGGSVMFSRTIRSTNMRGPRRRDLVPGDDPDHVLRDFQNMVGNMVGPGFRAGQPGRSGPDTLFQQGPMGNTFMFGGNAGNGGHGPRIMGGRVTFTGGRLQPRDPNGPQPAGPPVDDLATILGGLFAPVGGLGGTNERGPAGMPGMPPGLANLFQAMLNPANARSGDAVYTQEALDQIISQLMEQHPTSNAPGPASPDAIASLPKKNIDEKMLGPEGKAECSVCMDDVHIGTEVVALPCSHWFHETCASAWLSEHNTCPICRKGIDAQATPSESQRPSQTSNPTGRNERTRRFGLGRENSNTSRNEARLDSIRSASRSSPSEETSSPRRWQVVGENSPRAASSNSPPSDDFAAPMPGSFYRRPSDMSENQRDSRRGNTSGSDRSSRDSRRSSHSGGSSNGPVSWLRDRFGGGNRRND